MSERKERCETCRFWDATEGLNNCRRYPPTFTAIAIEPGEVENGTLEADLAFWPQTGPDDWCGEWQPKPKLKPAEYESPLSSLDFSTRVRKCLRSLDVSTIGDLCQITEGELLGVKNFGASCLHEVRNKLASLGLGLRDRRNH